MADDRAYKFAVDQKVRIKDGAAGRAAVVVARQAEPDHEEKYDIKRLPDGRVTCKSRAVPVNSYMLEFKGNNDRLDTAWHLEYDLVAAD